MKAVCWHGIKDMRVDSVPEPQILNPRDAILRITSTAICGSDLHLYNGYMPTMREGDIVGHEFMGEVVDIGSEVPYRQASDFHYLTGFPEPTMEAKAGPSAPSSLIRDSNAASTSHSPIPPPCTAGLPLASTWACHEVSVAVASGPGRDRPCWKR